MNIISKIEIHKEIFWSFLTKGLTLFIFIITNIFLARKLGVTMFGEWSYLLSIITILFTLGHLGINASARVFVANHKNTNNIGAVLRDAVNLRIKSSLIFVLVILSLLTFGSFFLETYRLKYMLLLSIPFIFLKTIVEFIKEIFQGFHRGVFQFFINLIEYGAYLFLLTIFFYKSTSLSLVLTSLSISTFLAVLLGGIFLYIIYKKEDKIESRFQKNIFTFALPLVIMSMGFVIIAEIDTIMLGFLSSKTEVAFYSIAKNIINKLPHIAMALSIGVMPIFININKNNSTILKNKFINIIKINSLIYIPITVIFIFFGDLIIKIMYGDGYISATLPLQILSLWLLMVSYNIFQSSLLEYQKKVWKRSLNFSFTIILNIILNYIFIPKYGAVGAAVATTISYIPYFIINWVDVEKQFLK